MGVLKKCIVITGGPCAGKTVTVLEIKDYLETLGYHVLLLNECATELILGGIKPFVFLIFKMKYLIYKDIKKRDI